jgi:hypothetical protein
LLGFDSGLVGVANDQKLENLVDQDWLRDVLGTLRGTLVRIREASANPEARTAIALVDTCLIILRKPKEEGHGQQIDRGGEKLPPDGAGEKVSAHGA